jgi:hypothetical protein
LDGARHTPANIARYGAVSGAASLRRKMVHPIVRVFIAASIAGAVMISAVLIDSSRDKSSPSVATAALLSTTRTVARPLDAPPLATVAAPAAENTMLGRTDEQILTLIESHPELRASVEELLNDPDPVVRKESAALVLELAAASAAARAE